MLIRFERSDDVTIYVVAAHIAYISPSGGHGGPTAIHLTNGQTIVVRQVVAEVLERLRAALGGETP